MLDDNSIEQSIETYSKIVYVKQLNNNNYFEVLVNASDSDYLNYFQKGRIIKIYKNGVEDFRGQIDIREITNEGLLRLMGVGLGEKKYVQPNAPNNSWQSESNSTILTALDDNVSGVSVGTVDSKNVNAFRTSSAQSCLQALFKLAKQTGQDAYFSYSGSTINVNLVDHQGSSTSVETLNGGIDTGVIRRKEDDSEKVKKVTVIGAGTGDDQVSGSYGPSFSQGDNEVTITDKSIMSDVEADERAEKEYDIRSLTKYTYTVPINDASRVFTLGDVISLKDDRTSTDTDLRITRIKRVVTMNDERVDLQVRGTSDRESEMDSLTAEKASRSSVRELESMNQGSINYNTWGSGINSKNNYPLKIGFYVSGDMAFVDGELNIDSLKLDYDVDKFKSNIGTASFTGSDPQVQNSSGNTQPNVTGRSSGKILASTSGVSVWNSFTVDYTSLGNYRSNVYVFENLIGGPSLETSKFVCKLMNVTGITVSVSPKWRAPSGSEAYFAQNYSLGTSHVASWQSGESSSSNDEGWYKCWDNNFECSACSGTMMNIYSHTHGSHDHGDGSYSSDNHGHPDGAYDVDASDLDNISIGDDVDDSASVNATEVDLYLDYWNGSSWVNKHSVLNTGKTIDTDVDLSGGGVYPDDTGYWRVRIDPDSSSPDYVQGVVKLKYNIK